MDHSVTKCNLQTEMSSIKSPQKLMTQDTSVNRNVTEFVDSDEDSNISLTKNSNFNKMFSRVNLREAMLKQAKIINKKVKTTVDSQTYLKQAISTHTKNQQSNLSKMIIYSNSLNTSNDNEMTDLEDLEKHKSKTLKTDKLHLVDLTKVLSLVKKQSLPTSSNNEKAYVISETLHKRNAIVDEVKLESPTTTTSVLNQTLFVRKPLKPTKIMNVLESNGNKPKLVSVRSLVRPSSRVIPYTIPRSKSKLIL